MAQLVEAGRGLDSQWGHWIFRGVVHSGRTVAFESTQLLTEMSTKKVSWADA
jgi:hypothetical protein